MCRNSRRGHEARHATSSLFRNMKASLSCTAFVGIRLTETKNERRVSQPFEGLINFLLSWLNSLKFSNARRNSSTMNKHCQDPTATLCMGLGAPARHVCAAERRLLLTYLLRQDPRRIRSSPCLSVHTVGYAYRRLTFEEIIRSPEWPRVLRARPRPHLHAQDVVSNAPRVW